MWRQWIEQSRRWRPVLALAGASVLAGAVHTGLTMIAKGWWPARLSWNLFLAWLPLLFAVLAARWETAGGLRARLGAPVAWLLWLVFFPNAPYICTDFVHLRWVALERFHLAGVMVMWFAVLGLFVGCVSLEVMRLSAARRFGGAAAWMLTVAATVASGFGVYLGREWRVNTWHLFSQPGQFHNLLQEVHRANKAMLAGEMVVLTLLLPAVVLVVHAVLRQFAGWDFSALIAPPASPRRP